MRKLVIISALIVGLFAGGFAQTPSGGDCPVVRVKGPGGIPKAGDLAAFSAEIDKKGQTLDAQYLWSITGTALVSGQGTDSVQVRWPLEGSVAVMVELVGLPGGCTGSATESVSIHKAPEAVKLFEVTDRDGYNQIPDLSAVVKEVQDRPDNQLYILVGNVRSQYSEVQEKAVRHILIALAAQDVRPDFITEARAFAKRDFIQIWRVPPGAENPKCDECEQNEQTQRTQACPTISVTGPAGVTRPGEPFTVSANISGDVPKYITYTWSVSSGRILEGQGTNKIKVSTEKWKDVKSTATVKLGGLPDDCPDTAEETVVTAVHWQTFLADEFVEFSKSQGIEKLSAINFEPVTKGPFSIYFVAGVTAEKTQVEIKAQAAEFKRYLVNERKVPADRIFYFYRKSRDAKISVYMVPLGSEPPECEECEKIDLIANRRLQNSSRN